MTDTLNNCIKKFNSDGNLITRWGSLGSRNGQFFNPHGIAIDKNGNVFVVDWGNSRIQKFTSDGKFITKWGSLGHDDGQFGALREIEIDDSNNVYVVDSNYEGLFHSPRIQKFTSKGVFITKWGLSGEGELYNPAGVAVDKNKNLYVTDTGGISRIMRYSSNGKFLTK